MNLWERVCDWWRRPRPGNQLTGWIDEDRPLLPALDRSQRIDYFERRVRLVALAPLTRLLRFEMKPSGPSSATLIFGVSACCVIEALGKFVSGGAPGNSARFYAFVDTYLSTDYRTMRVNGELYKEALWKYFRNGLAHGFTILHGGLVGHPRHRPYFIVSNQSLVINPWSLLDDVSAGLGRYVQDLRQVPPTDALAVNFDRVFEDVFIRGL